MNQERLWILFAIVAGIGLTYQLSRPADWADRPETSFDTAPRGHAGVLALLDRFDAVRGRWLSGVSMPPVEGTIWWIAPDGACETRAAAEVTKTAEESDAQVESETPLASPFEVVVRPWIEAGGTAIVWLSHPPIEPPIESPIEARAAPDEGERAGSEDVAASPDASSASADDETETQDAKDVRDRWGASLTEVREELRNGAPEICNGLAGLDLPPRMLAGLEGGAAPVEGRLSPVVFSIRRVVDARGTRDEGQRRVLPGPTLAFFDLDPIAAEAQGWRPLWVEADDATPLALERRVGKGRLVVIADARVVTNDRLASVDSAPFVFDWVRDYGTPWLDEHAHGVVPEAGTFRYLAHSPAWAAGLGMLIVGALVIWRGRAWPAREVVELDPDAPTLAGFVDSLARLYAGTRDHARVFERYRGVSLDRIRRALGLAPGTSSEIVLSTLRAKAKNWPELGETGLGQLLTKNVPIPGAEDLARNAARLDELVGVLRSGRGSRSAGAPPSESQRLD